MNDGTDGTARALPWVRPEEVPYETSQQQFAKDRQNLRRDPVRRARIGDYCRLLRWTEDGEGVVQTPSGSGSISDLAAARAGRAEARNSCGEVCREEGCGRETEVGPDDFQEPRLRCLVPVSLAVCVLERKDGCDRRRFA